MGFRPVSCTAWKSKSCAPSPVAVAFAGKSYTSLVPKVPFLGGKLSSYAKKWLLDVRTTLVFQILGYTRVPFKKVHIVGFVFLGSFLYCLSFGIWSYRYRVSERWMQELNVVGNF